VSPTERELRPLDDHWAPEPVLALKTNFAGYLREAHSRALRDLKRPGVGDLKWISLNRWIEIKKDEDMQKEVGERFCRDAMRWFENTHGSDWTALPLYFSGWDARSCDGFYNSSISPSGASGMTFKKLVFALALVKSNKGAEAVPQLLDALRELPNPGDGSPSWD
jgi:hypothetical protein